MSQLQINKPFYTMAVNGEVGTITMYGDIVESRPYDLWEERYVDGDFIIQGEFMEDLKQVENCSEIVIRMNSCGGDVSVAVLIHNRLRELAHNGKKLTCIVDGVAMSGGSLIMCACDTVKVNPSSLIMIHKCWSFVIGAYNADDLRNMAKSADEYDKAQVTIYARKTKLSDTVLLHMMADTTYMTGKEAVEKGFADELLEGEGLALAASANRNVMYVGGRKIAMGKKVPDYIPLVEPAPQAAETNKDVPEDGEGGKNMAKTIEELRKEFPELCAELQASAVNAEQERLQKIDELSALIDPAMVAEAKYGEKACTAEQLAYRAAVDASKKGKGFLADLQKDAGESKAQEVPAAGAPVENAKVKETPETKMANARKEIAELLGKEAK